MTPNYRRAARRLDDDDVQRLVAMRRAGATWKEIGRVFGKQDTACKSIFDRATGAAADA